MTHIDLGAVSAARPLPSLRKSYTRYGKRVFDLALALALLPFLAPVIALIWLIVRSDGGPGFFAHTRIGRGGQSFRCWKLRTMVPDADRVLAKLLRDDPAAAAEWASRFKLDDDPRVTRIGRFLRRTSLDELPQIWNVIRGEMSFVGPRPVTAQELSFYGANRSAYLALRPGITGIWQVEGRRDGCYVRRVRMDRRYRHAQCLGLDLSLIARTALCVVRPTGR